jgi:repressor LexA
MHDLTRRQQDILTYLESYQAEKGYSPTYQEIADHFGLASKFGVLRHIEALLNKGYLYKEDTAERNLRVSQVPAAADDNHAEILEIPLFDGRVAAGGPVFTSSDIETLLPIPRRLLSDPGSYFSVRVQGDSMTGAGIFDGDLVIVQRSNQARPGAIVVALIDGEVTVKRLREDNGHSYLQAENPAFSDIHPSGDWHIQGRVVSLLRDRVI